MTTNRAVSTVVRVRVELETSDGKRFESVVVRRETLQEMMNDQGSLGGLLRRILARQP
jgi:hypothetical protein